MTREDFENQHVNMVNHLIDLTHEAADVWKFHPENPNRIDPVSYHDLIVTQIQQLEEKIADFTAKYDNV